MTALKPARPPASSMVGGSGVVLWAYHGDDVPVGPAAVLDPADVRQDGAAGARRLAVGVGGGAVLLPGRAAGRLLLRASADRARRPPRMTGVIHLARLPAGAACACRSGCRASWGEPPPGEPYLWQLGLFTVAIGLPFVAVSANAPLLQAWFARTGHPHGARSLLPLCGQQPRQPDRAAGLSVRARAGVRAEGAEPALDARLPAADGRAGAGCSC